MPSGCTAHIGESLFFGVSGKINAGLQLPLAMAGLVWLLLQKLPSAFLPTENYLFDGRLIMW